MSRVDVLIVDDDEDLLTVIELLVEDLGYEVRTARNGREAYDRAIAHHPRLVLSDLMMPFMRGDRLIASLHDNPETADIPCILMTSAPTRIQGFDGHLITKPFNLDELATLVHRHLDDPHAV